MDENIDIELSLEEEENLIYGTDFQVNNPELPNNQIAVVMGQDNLSQAIEHRLMTPLNLYYDIVGEFGTDIRDFIAMKQKPEVRQWICFHIQALIEQDERISEARVHWDNDVGFVLNYVPTNNTESISVNVSEMSNNDTVEGGEESEL